MSIISKQGNTVKLLGYISYRDAFKAIFGQLTDPVNGVIKKLNEQFKSNNLNFTISTLPVKLNTFVLPNPDLTKKIVERNNRKNRLLHLLPESF